MTIEEFQKRQSKPDDKWLFAEPWSAEKLAEYRKDLAVHHGGLPEVLQCDSCGLAGVCSLVYDPYNSPGDFCLLDK